MHDLNTMKEIGLSLTCQSIYFGGNSYICVTANYLTEEWQLTKRSLKVVQCEGTPTAKDFVDVVVKAMEENQITNAKTILLSFDADFDDEQELVGLPENVVVIKNVIRALNQILTECFDNCSDKERTFEIIDLCKRIVKLLLEKELLVKEMPAVLSNVKLVKSLPDDYLMGVFLMLKFVKEHQNQIQQELEAINATEMINQIRQTDWGKANEIEVFLNIFYDTIKEFGVHQEPMFQAVIIIAFLGIII
jgi:hypothetical protein